MFQLTQHLDVRPETHGKPLVRLTLSVLSLAQANQAERFSKQRKVVPSAVAAPCDDCLALVYFAGLEQRTLLWRVEGEKEER